MAELPVEPRPIAEISHGPSASEQFLEKNQKLLIVVAILLAIVAAGIVVKRGMDEGARLAAGAAMQDAEDVAAMQDVVKNHAGTPTEATASVFLSDLQWEQGQQSAALETLKAVIEAQPEHPAVIPARARLGARLREQGDTAGAKDIFKALSEDPAATWIAPYALISLADIAREEGDAEAAKALLTKVNEDFPTSMFSGSAGQLAKFADFKFPTEIDPPADELPATTDGGLPNPGEDAATTTTDGPSNPLLDALSETPAEETEAPEAPPAPEQPAITPPAPEAPDAGGE